MTLRLRILVLISFAILLIIPVFLPVQAAVPQQCIQAKNRIKACPHQLYRADRLPSQNSMQLLCICITDFEPLLRKTAGEQQKIEQNMTRRQFEVHFGEDLPVILAILKRQR